MLKSSPSLNAKNDAVPVFLLGPVTGPVATNVIPAVLLDAPILVQSTLPAVTIVYVISAWKLPATIVYIIVGFCVLKKLDCRVSLIGYCARISFAYCK